MKTPTRKTIIPNAYKLPRPPRILNVAAYCRVSSERDEQESSITIQYSYFQESIKAHPGWVLADIYADRRSGKNTRNRPEFRRMMSDCHNGEVRPDRDQCGYELRTVFIGDQCLSIVEDSVGIS